MGIQHNPASIWEISSGLSNLHTNTAMHDPADVHLVFQAGLAGECFRGDLRFDVFFFIPVGNMGPKIGYSWLYLSGNKYDKPLVFGVLVFASGPKTVLVKLTCLRTCNYVTNFSNHLHGVGWGGVGY